MESSKEIQMEPGSSSATQMDAGSSSSMQIDPEIANFETLIHYGLGPRLHFMSLGHVIQTRYQYGLPEEFIAIIMRDVLRALVYLLVYKSFDHPDLNSSQVFICHDEDFVTIKILADPSLKDWHGGQVLFTSTQGIWDLGTIALEMVYGSCIGTYNLNPWFLIVNNVVTVLKLILDNPDEEGEETAQQKEKAIEKGKQKLGLEDDPAGKTMAEEKRKEKAKMKGKEQKKLIIELPPFENLINPLYVEELVDKSNRGKEDQEKENGNAELKEKLKTAMIFNCCRRVKEAKKKFSRDFLEVVLMCLDESRQPTAKEILEHPFFHQPLNVQKFERTMRSIPPQIWDPSEVIP